MYYSPEKEYRGKRPASSSPSKLLLQFPVVHFNQSRPSVRTGVGHGAAAQIPDEVLQFRSAQRIVGFHRMAADGFCHRVFAEPQRIDLLSRRLEFVHQIEREP